jgi:hypothetical protein
LVRGNPEARLKFNDLEAPALVTQTARLDARKKVEVAEKMLEDLSTFMEGRPSPGQARSYKSNNRKDTSKMVMEKLRRTYAFDC